MFICSLFCVHHPIIDCVSKIETKRTQRQQRTERKERHHYGRKNGTTTTTTITTEKKGYTTLVVLITFTITLLLGLAFYAEQPIRSTYYVGGSGGAASLYGNKNAKEDWCDCASCNWYYGYGLNCVCTPPSETVHCPAMGPACSTTAIQFVGDDVDCTQITAQNFGMDCTDVVAHMTMNFVYYKCMDDPNRSDGVCANQNVCEYA